MEQLATSYTGNPNRDDLAELTFRRPDYNEDDDSGYFENDPFYLELDQKSLSEQRFSAMGFASYQVCSEPFDDERYQEYEEYEKYEEYEPHEEYEEIEEVEPYVDEEEREKWMSIARGWRMNNEIPEPREIPSWELF